MTSYQLRGRVRPDGTLDLHVPTGMPGAEVEVLVVVQPVPTVNGATGHTERGKTPEELGWPPGFFEETAGCWEGEPLERAPQGEYEVREPLL